MAIQQVKYNQKIKFFRKNKDKTLGSAISFVYLPNKLMENTEKYHDKEPKVLIEFAKLIPGTDRYDWTGPSKIVLNLSMQEVAEFLALIDRKIEKFNCFHSPKGKSGHVTMSANLTINETNRQVESLSLFLSQSGEEKKGAFKFNMPEIYCLRYLLDEAIRRMIDWGNN